MHGTMVDCIFKVWSHMWANGIRHRPPQHSGTAVPPTGCVFGVSHTNMVLFVLPHMRWFNLSKIEATLDPLIQTSILLPEIQAAAVMALMALVTVRGCGVNAVALCENMKGLALCECHSPVVGSTAFMPTRANLDCVWCLRDQQLSRVGYMPAGFSREGGSSIY